MELYQIDNEIKNCNLCGCMVEKFNNYATVSIGNKSDIVILGEHLQIMAGEKAELHGMMKITI